MTDIITNNDICPKCGEKTEREAHFCGNCGHPLVADTLPEQTGVAAEAAADDTIPVYAQPDPEVRKADGKAFTTLILAIIGLFMFWLPLVGLVMATVAIVMAVRARRNDGSKSLTIAAIIVGCLTFVFVVAGVVLSVVFSDRLAAGGF